MIQLFRHYVPVRLMFLVALEALVLLIAAYAGISLNIAEPGVAIWGNALAIPSHAGAFALGMMIVMSSMGLYQPDLSNDIRSTRLRLFTSFALEIGRASCRERV